MNKGLLTSASDEWSTPQDFYDRLNRIFCFNLDAAADDENHKCDRYFTKEHDGLSQSWGGVQSMVQSSVWQIHRGMGKKGL